MILHRVLVLVPVAFLCIFPQNWASSSSSFPTSNHQCPLDFNYVQNISWDSSSCQNNSGRTAKLDSNSNCCQTLTSLYGVAFAQHLRQTSLFRLPDLETSVSCLSEFQKTLSNLRLSADLTSFCFRPQKFVNSTNVCANIQTKQDWLSVLGPSTSLDTGCGQDLSDLTACDACVIAGFRVLSQLIAADGNSSRSKDCFRYTVLYAAGIVNELGPKSDGALSCIFGLPLTMKTVSKSSDMWVLIFGSVGGGFAVIALSCLICFWLRWSDIRRREKVSEIFSILDPDSDENALLNWRPKTDSLWFNSQDLEKATDNFSPKNLIGKGQFGTVYKGKLPDGTIIAVKKIMDSDFQGDAEFCREVEIISTLKHRNLVPLRGCCVSDEDNSPFLCNPPFFFLSLSPLSPSWEILQSHQHRIFTEFLESRSLHPTSRISLGPRGTIPTSTDFLASFHKISPNGGSTSPSTPSTPKDQPFLSKTASRRCTTPIFFSQSAVRRKPPPIEKKLECTLEELCVGCVKKIKITRDVISNTGFIVQEEEILMIRVKPGWKKGTKITFEGKGDERPGTLPADIIFAIDEKRHPIFKREGDDLELGVEVPLVQALTGCTISVPLLGGGHISLSIEDIIYPGYEKIIPGQGMPISKDEGKRGDLRLKFLVEFPDELSNEQRLEVVSILEECS